jgi:hypothetical protein
MRPSCVASCSLLRLDPPPDTKIASALLVLSRSSPDFALVAATLFVTEVDRRCGDDSALTAGNRAPRPPVLTRTSQRPTARLADPPTTRAGGRRRSHTAGAECPRTVHSFTHAQASVVPMCCTQTGKCQFARACSQCPTHCTATWLIRRLGTLPPCGEVEWMMPTAVLHEGARAHAGRAKTTEHNKQKASCLLCRGIASAL